MKANLTPKVLAGILGAAVALVGLGGWFGLVSSQHSASSSLDGQIANEQTNLESAKTLAKLNGDGKGQAPLALLAKALPTDVGMPTVLLQVQNLASASSVDLEGFAPSTVMPLTGYDAIPIDVTVTGRYAQIQHFVRQLRLQAGTSEGGRVHAAGRLFAVETLELAPGSDGLPELNATIRIDAFVFHPAPAETDSGTASATPTTSGSTSALGPTIKPAEGSS